MAHYASYIIIIVITTSATRQYDGVERYDRAFCLSLPGSAEPRCVYTQYITETNDHYYFTTIMITTILQL